MSDITQTLGTSAGNGHLPTLTHRGKTFKASLFFQAQKTRYENWLKGQAWASLEARKPYISAEEYAEKEEALQTLMELGYYSYHSPTGVRSHGTPTGTIALIGIMFDCSDDEASFLYFERNEDVVRLLNQQMRASSPVIPQKPKAEQPEEPASPNVEQPAASVTGAPAGDEKSSATESFFGTPLPLTSAESSEEVSTPQ